MGLCARNATQPPQEGSLESSVALCSSVPALKAPESTATLMGTSHCLLSVEMAESRVLRVHPAGRQEQHKQRSTLSQAIPAPSSATQTSSLGSPPCVTPVPQMETSGMRQAVTARCAHRRQSAATFASATTGNSVGVCFRLKHMHCRGLLPTCMRTADGAVIEVCGHAC